MDIFRGKINKKSLLSPQGEKKCLTDHIRRNSEENGIEISSTHFAVKNLKVAHLNSRHHLANGVRLNRSEKVTSGTPMSSMRARAHTHTSTHTHTHIQNNKQTNKQETTTTHTEGETHGQFYDVCIESLRFSLKCRRCSMWINLWT